MPVQLRKQRKTEAKRVDVPGHDTHGAWWIAQTTRRGKGDSVGSGQHCVTQGTVGTARLTGALLQTPDMDPISQP
ncbi:hypothetical protein EMQ_1337 [Acetobacter aceti NBRC 14818]|uniref:Transposase n=1 Tax=Acetobacter aceti NBRC 14818 TaxID=887700 RepID=A0AB33ID86_ACEAC|nr:hypothetical protein EMQ_1337 [Acetobacter aceti NBRC 14818]GAN57910.1 hypothetical protein Abac_022_043 [Acetobacter aceti NBRC 14818]